MKEPRFIDLRNGGNLDRVYDEPFVSFDNPRGNATMRKTWLWIAGGTVVFWVGVIAAWVSP